MPGTGEKSQEKVPRAIRRKSTGSPAALKATAYMRSGGLSLWRQCFSIFLTPSHEKPNARFSRQTKPLIPCDGLAGLENWALEPFKYLSGLTAAGWPAVLLIILSQGALPFSRKHPLACWLSSMVSIFAGGLLANAILGEPMMGVFKTNQQLLLATLIWYIIFYSPFDIGYKFFKFLPIKLLMCAMKEMYRTKKVYDGVTHAAKLFPTSYVTMLAVGTIKGNGSAFVKMFERLLRGVWTPTANEILTPSFPTKASLAAAFIFMLDKKTDYISAPHALVYFGITIFFVYFKLSSMLLGIHDPFVPFENMFCTIFMGGLVDSLSKAIGGKGAAAEGGKQDAAKTDAQASKKKD